jgi:hypothetical protein
MYAPRHGCSRIRSRLNSIAMDLSQAGKLARELLDRHGLADWRFQWDRARRRFGSCSTTRKRITLSIYLTKLNDEAEVRDTILHEIAHALTPGDGHGRAWKAACARIGAKPDRCYRESVETGGVVDANGNGVVAPRTGLRIGCVTCNWWVGRHRVTWAIQNCRKCGMQVLWEHVRTGKRYRIERGVGGFKAVISS